MATHQILAEGIDAIRKHYARRFDNSPHLKCTVTQRITQGDWVIDHETVEGIGEATVNVVAAYHVENDLISSIFFMS